MSAIKSSGSIATDTANSNIINLDDCPESPPPIGSPTPPKKPSKAKPKKVIKLTPDGTNHQQRRAIVSVGKKAGYEINFNIPIADDFPHVKENGAKRCTIANLKHLFNIYGIKLFYDEVLKEQTMLLGNDFDSGHSDLIANSNLAHLRSLLSLNGMSAGALELLSALFAENSSNPILDWIESKKWDKQSRIGELVNTLTVDNKDYHYLYVALKTWLIQCVAAADGSRRTTNKDALAKYELVFVLQGGQGVQKTSWLGHLLPKELKRYFIDGMHLDPAIIDSIRQANACWICELGELDTTFKKDVSRLKAYLSKQNDSLRLPYDRAASSLIRNTSYCGSVNPEIFLVDSTGNRRFLPVQVLAANHLHTVDMQQLWAEILTLYLSGEQWWCSKELEVMLVERHARHSETSPIHDMVNSIFDIEQPIKGLDHKHLTPTAILQACGIKEPKQAQSTLVNSYLKSRGFEPVQSRGCLGFWVAKLPFLPD